MGVLLTVKHYTKNLGGNPFLIDDDGSIVEIYFIKSPMDYPSEQGIKISFVGLKDSKKAFSLFVLKTGTI